ncbi:MAG: FeoA family protein [Polaromonas sp.]|jgi:ferrous iron transport protein A|uniref:FeoA family protein n=1 Tax=Polaromonas sp. TaxID=1869339 RepID=UPI00272F1C9A|nr:FeoA family protein [Polaromonas sp.]MDP2255800.1 FeoA family protein [Polaromonas sp.]
MSGESDIGLHELPRRISARVVRLMPAVDTEDGEVLLRLLEIGFLPGELVRVMARGFPGGDPVAVRVGQTTFALRSHEAALIRVSPLAMEASKA